MKQKVVRYLSFLPSLLVSLALETIFPLLAMAQVQEADSAIVAGCTFLGYVQGSSGWGGLLAGTGRRQAKKDALGDAAKLGGTHIVWDNVDGGGFATGASAIGRAYNCNSRQQNSSIPSAEPAVSSNSSSPATISICADTSIPTGYIKVNDEWSSSRCGNPTSVSYNVWTLVKYVDMSPGMTLEVCADALTPSGWAIVNSQWNPTRCGYPKTNTTNIKTIQRVP